MAIEDLIKTLNEAADTTLYRDATEEDREKLLAACGRLQNAAESPMQTTWRIVLAVSPNRTVVSFLDIFC